MTSAEQQPDSPAPEAVGSIRWRAVLLAAVAACAACGIVYELALLTLSTSLNGGGIVATSLIVAGYIAALGAGAQTLDLADKPLFSTTSVPGNLLLDLSVEYPTANSSAYFSTTAYSSSTVYVGYFDGAKCYRYVYGPNQSPATSASSSYFQPDSAATSQTCTSTSSKPKSWSLDSETFAATTLPAAAGSDPLQGFSSWDQRSINSGQLDSYLTSNPAPADFESHRPCRTVRSDGSSRGCGAIRAGPAPHKGSSYDQISLV